MREALTGLKRYIITPRVSNSDSFAGLPPRYPQTQPLLCLPAMTTSSSGCCIRASMR
jgi:hypothetical protein